MPIEMFLVPMIGTGSDGNGGVEPEDPYRAKYLFETPAPRRGVGICSSSRGVDIALMVIETTQANLDNIAAQPDTVRVATGDTIDSTLTVGQASAVKAIFENLKIPQGFANAGDTRRTVVRRLLGFMMFNSRLSAKFGTNWRKRLSDNGKTLDSTWAELPQGMKDELVGAWVGKARILGTPPTPADSTTVRSILQQLVNRFEQRSFDLGLVTI